MGFPELGYIVTAGILLIAGGFFAGCPSEANAPVVTHNSCNHANGNLSVSDPEGHLIVAQ